MLQIRLFGAFSCHLGDNNSPLTIGSKQTALVALLATAADGKRTRTWLYNILWPLTGLEQQRGSLRQAIAAIKRKIGTDFENIFEIDNYSLKLKLDCCKIVGCPQDGAFLEGLQIAGAKAFQEWVSRRRHALAAGLDEPQEISITGSYTRNVSIRPSIAIVPFATVSGSDLSPHFGDLIACDISRYLCRAPGIDVISYLSCRTDSFRKSGALELKDRFRINYLVSGHIRKVGRNVRLDLEFIDVATAKIMTAEVFEAPERDFLEGSVDNIDKIARFIARMMFESALNKTLKTENRNVDAHTLLMSSIVLMHRQDLASFSKSRKQLETVIHRYPEQSIPHAWLAKWYVLFISQGWSMNVPKDAQNAKNAVSRALSINPTCSFSQVIEGLIEYQLFRNFKEANAQFGSVLNFDENNALAWIMRGTLYAFEGKGRTAVSFVDRARYLSPLEPGSYLFETLSAAAYLADHKYEKALEFCDSSLEKNNFHISSLRAKTVALHGLGRMQEARETAKKLLHLEPTLTIVDYLSNHAASKFQIGQEWARALRDSGIPAK